VSWRLVDGVPVPDAVGGHAALDFCNTRAGWGAPAPKEYLTGPHALVVWARTTGLLASPGPGPTGPGDRAGDDDPAEDDALARALALRDALYACALHRGDPADWALVSAEAARARAAAVLVPAAGGQAAVWRPDPALGPAATALTAVAAAAEDLLTSSLCAFVAACPGEGCGWLFADRRGKRRWCSMAACGNRAKARRYAERRAVDGAVTQRSGGTTNRPNS
jgi:predicted RNA-binding Zn ribbon-like protein